MITKITGGRVVLDNGIFDSLNVYIKDEKICAVTEENLAFDREIDAKGRYISPGFIEIHSHGAGGCDFLDGTAEAFLTAAEKHLKHGVTTLIPTATSSEIEATIEIQKIYEEACEKNTIGADMPGLHLEGPYFAYGQRGAQDPRYLRDPSPEEYEKILDACKSVLRWSVAPELPGAIEMGKALQKRGILPAVGHSDAEWDDMEKAFDAGFTHVTHLYSGMSTVHRKNAYRYIGVVESAYLIDDMTVEIIADGKHLPAELLKFVYKFKGPDKIALITDSMRGADMPDGESMLGHYKNGLPCIIEEGVAKLPDRTAFAGSVATFDRLVRNMINMAQVPVHEAVKMATKTPAKIMNFKDRGTLAPGLRADIILFNDHIDISFAMVNGKILFEA